MNVFLATFRRDVALAFREGGGWSHALVFFLLYAGLAAFAVGPSQEAQARFAPAALFLGATLATLVASLDLFAPDLEDGVVDVAIAEGAPLLPIAAAKIAALWASTLAPLIAAAPLVAMMLGLSGDAPWTVAALLALASPALALSAAIGAALSGGARGGALLAILITGPLIAPALIFGVGAAEAAIAGGGLWSADARLLAAADLLAAVVAPPAAAAALRLHAE